MNIEIETDKLREILRTNRESHVATYEEARREYKQRLVNALDEAADHVDDWDADGPDDPPTVWDRLDMPVPENHATEYDRAIEMLEHETRDAIPLSESDYQKFVQDEWSWKRRWEANTVSYAGRELT